MAVMGSEIQFKGYEQHQGQLFPAHLSEALDPGDPVFFISDLVEGLDLEVFERRYAVMGEHAHPPRLLLKLWLFGRSKGCTAVARSPGGCAGTCASATSPAASSPDFRTINRFRVLHREDFAEVFRQTVRTARASGLGKLGRVAIDGSKIRANTSRHKAMSHAADEGSRGAAGGRDRADPGADGRAATRPRTTSTATTTEAEVCRPSCRDREQRVAKLRAVRKQLEAERGSELRPQNQKSFADPDANMMMTGEGSLQYCYNAQAATSEDGILVAAEITTSPRDVGQLVPMVEAVKANTGRRPGIAVADNGYLSEANLEQLHRRRQRCLVAAGRDRKKPSWPSDTLTRTQRMHRILRLPWARRIYDHRKTQGERPFAEIKQTMRFRRFSLRGRANIRGEWNLVCAAANALTMHRAAMA